MLDTVCKADFVQGVIQEVGEIERDEGRSVVVTTPGGIVRASVALSCLVWPARGDSVLLARHGGQAFILAVLQRAEGAGVVMNLQGPVRLDVSGTMTLAATDGLELRGGQRARLAAQDVAIDGRAISLTGAEVHIAARALNWLADTLESTARVIKQSSELWFARSKLHQRHTEGLEQARAGNLELSASEIITVQARHTLMNSTDLTKIDAQQIQMG